MSAAGLQRRRLASLVGSVTACGGAAPAGTGGEGLPAAWEWAVGLTMSRPFRMRMPAVTQGEPRGSQGQASIPGSSISDADASISGPSISGADASISEPSISGGDASTSGAPGVFPPGARLTAFVPFVDMANHASDPSCEVQGRVAEGGAGFSAVALVARRDLAAGQEVTLRYFGPAPNAYTFCSFGFVPPGVNRHDRLGLPLDAPPLSAAAVKETVRQLRQEWPGGWPAVAGRQDGAGEDGADGGVGGGGAGGDRGALLEAALLSLPLSRETSTPEASVEVSRADALLQWLDAEAQRDFVTSMAEDEAWLQRHRMPPGAAVWAADSAFGTGGAHCGAGGGVPAGSGAAGEGPGGAGGAEMDPRLPDLMEYRLQRKRLWGLAREVLAAHAARHRAGGGGGGVPG